LLPPIFLSIYTSCHCTTTNIRSLSRRPRVSAPFSNRLWAPALPDPFLGRRHRPFRALTRPSPFFEPLFSSARISWGARNFSASKNSHAHSHNLPLPSQPPFTACLMVLYLRHTRKPYAHSFYHLMTPYRSHRGSSTATSPLWPRISPVSAVFVRFSSSASPHSF